MAQMRKNWTAEELEIATRLHAESQRDLANDSREAETNPVEQTAPIEPVRLCREGETIDPHAVFLEEIDDEFLVDSWITNGGNTMSMLTEMLSSIGKEVVDGFGGAVAEARGALIDESWFGRNAGHAENMGGALDAAADKIVDGVGDTNKSMLGEMMEKYAPLPMDHGQEPNLDHQPDLEQER
jgi:hypothetical protein